MADRQQLQTNLTVDPDVQRLLEEARTSSVSDEELREQRVSFAFGNAPESNHITKDSVRSASQKIRLT